MDLNRPLSKSQNQRTEYSYINADLSWQPISHQPVREAVSYRGLFTAGWFGVREKHCSRLEIYDRLRASEQVEESPGIIYHSDVITTELIITDATFTTDLLKNGGDTHYRRFLL